MTTIPLQQFHNLLSDAYAVTINDYVYIVSCDSFGDWTASDGDDTVNLSSVDGDIEIDETGVFFYISGEPIKLKFVNLRCFSSDEIANLATDKE